MNHPPDDRLAQLHYTLSGLRGRTIDTGVVHWISAADQLGSQDVAITVDDGRGR
jgi:hypothetical protein